MLLGSRSATAVSHSACAPLEARAAKAGRRDRARDPRPPLSARHIEMEQDRAPDVLPHHAELARPAAYGSPCSGRVDRRDDDQGRSEGRKRLDTRSYQKGIKVSKAAMKCLDIIGDQFHPEWNYTI